MLMYLITIFLSLVSLLEALVIPPSISHYSKLKRDSYRRRCENENTKFSLKFQDSFNASPRPTIFTCNAQTTAVEEAGDETLVECLPQNVGIVGAGAIAFGTASLIAQGGNDPMLWSPSGLGTSELISNELSAIGAMEFTCQPRVAKTPKELVEGNDVIVFALPANGHKKVFELVAPFVRKDQRIIISSHASLGALYLSQLLEEYHGTTMDGDSHVPITCWGTTVCTARKPSSTEVRVNTVRQSVDLCTVPKKRSNEGLELCKQLFRQVDFRPRDGLLAISLSNVNPQNHLGIAMGNMGRMEKGEDWYQLLNITPNIGRLLEALDRERLNIAKELGLEVKTIFEHFHLSFHVPITDSISDMNQEIHALGNDVYGPNTADSRYVTEDVPFGLALTIVLGNLVGQPAALHLSGVQIMSAMYGRNFMEENDLLNALQLENYTLKDLEKAAYSGVLPKQQ